MKRTLKTFPDKDLVVPLECDGGETDKLCHKNEQTYIDNLMAIVDWKREFVEELGEQLAEAEKHMKSWEYGGTEWHRTANAWGYFKIKEILGEAPQP